MPSNGGGGGGGRRRPRRSSLSESEAEIDRNVLFPDEDEAVDEEEEEGEDLFPDNFMEQSVFSLLLLSRV